MHNETDKIPACGGCMVSKTHQDVDVTSVTPWELRDPASCNCGRTTCVVGKGEVYVSIVEGLTDLRKRTFRAEFHHKYGGEITEMANEDLSTEMLQ